MGKTTTTPSAQAAPASFEAALAELEQLTESLESAQLPLDALLQSYERGAFLLQHCQTQLQAVETQVRLIDERLQTEDDV